MYAVLPSKAKPSKSLSTDRTRPVLMYAELRQCADDSWELVACDSYQLARIPLAVKEVDAGEPLTPGPISPEALKACEKAGAFRANGTIEPCAPNGATVGQSFVRPMDIGTFPNWDQLQPDPPHEQDTYLIRLNAQKLLELAQALGARKHEVTLRVDLAAGPGGKRPTSQMRPIIVSADGVEFNNLLMPVRVTT